jgi:hypothetical protein
MDSYDRDYCRLVTDLGTFAAAGETLATTNWGHDQDIGGYSFKSYCDDKVDGPCTHASTEFGGGNVSPRDGDELHSFGRVPSVLSQQILLPSYSVDSVVIG